MSHPFPLDRGFRVAALLGVLAVALSGAVGDESWHGLGRGYGASSRVRWTCVSGTDVYVGGDFLGVDALPASRIARFDGTAWSGLGGGLSDSCSGIVTLGGTLYAVGAFTVADSRFTTGGIPAQHVAA